MPTLKAKKGDETVEIEFDEILDPPEGLIPEKEIEDKYVTKDYFKSEVDRRAKAAYDNAREKLASDEDFIRKQIRKRGGEFDEEGNLKSPKDVDIDKLTEDIRNEIRTEEVEPVKAENQSLKSSQLSSQVLRTGQKHGLTKDALRPIRSGKSAIEVMAEDHFAWHPEKGMWAQVDGDGNFIGGANGLRTIDDWYKDLKKNDDYADWFSDQTQKGSDYRGPSTRGNGADDDFEQKKAKVRQIRGIK